MDMVGFMSIYMDIKHNYTIFIALYTIFILVFRLKYVYIMYIPSTVPRLTRKLSYSPNIK